MKTKIINCNTDLGITIDGADKGPRKITESLNNSNILEIYNIDKENIEKNRDKTNLEKNLDSINIFTKKHFELTKNVIKDDFFPLTLGGDHTVAMGSILASNTLNKNIGIIWIDAHGDFNTFETTETGNIHGLPLAAVTGYKCEKLTSFLDCSFVNPKKCVIVGARSIDKLELDNLKDAGVTMFYMDDIKDLGIEKVMEESFSIAGNKVHVSYDLDAIDPEDAPGVSTKAPFGINKKEAFEIADIICENMNKVVSMDVVEYNPLNDIDDKTKNIAIEIINKVVNSKN